MDTISELLVNWFIWDGLLPSLFGCFGVEGRYHLRCCLWFWNKISETIRLHCLRRLGVLILILLVYKFANCDSVTGLPCTVVHGKCTRLFLDCQVFLRFCYESRATFWSHRRVLDISVRLRRTVLSYNTGIFDKNLSPVRE